MDLGLNGRRAAVAASSMGLGYACALELAREGAAVSICSRNADRIEAAATRIRHDVPGANICTSVVDVSSQADCERFVADTVETLGGIDILVTNTGGPVPGALDAITLDDIRDGFDSTLMSAVTMMKTAVGYMREAKWGRIINILSMTVKQPKTNLLVSNTMRPAVLGFAKSISNELAGAGVTVNNVAPGYTMTERLTELAEHLSKTQKRTVEDVFDEWKRVIPAKRLGRPEELGAVVAFLASEQAAYVTGVTLQVDGGSVQGLF